MNRLNNMTVKTSWSLVLLAFSVIILLIGGLSIYTSHQSRQSFETLNQTHVERAGALQRTYINLLQAQVAMDRAAELVRVPSFDEPGPVLDQAAAFIEQAQRHFENFLAMTGEGAAMQAVVPLSDAMDRLTDVGLRLQLVLLREGDFAGYRSGRSRLNGMSQDFINAADAFLADSRAAANALVSRFDRRVQRLDAAMVAAVIAALLMVAAVLWGITVNVIRPLRNVIGHLDRIADGDLSEAIPPRGNNDIGRLYAGLARMQGSLAAIVGQVRTSSERIQDAAVETTRGNTDLSTRFEQLSASLVETSASMEQLTATVKDNDEHADQAHRLAGDAGGVASSRAWRHCWRSCSWFRRQRRSSWSMLPGTLPTTHPETVVVTPIRVRGSPVPCVRPSKKTTPSAAARSSRCFRSRMCSSSTRCFRVSRSRAMSRSKVPVRSCL